MNELTLYSKPACPQCDQAKRFLSTNNIPFTVVDITQNTASREFIMTQGHKSVPQIYLNAELFVEDGWTGLSKLSPDYIKTRLEPPKLGTL